MKDYSASLWDHFERPRNVGALQRAQAIGHASLDGQRAFSTVYLAVDETERIKAAGFETRGCGYSVAVCSALTEWIVGEPPEACRRLSHKMLLDAFGSLPPHKHYCAELAVEALHDALDQLCEDSPNSPDVD